MLDEILIAVGAPYSETRFEQAPSKTFIIYDDSYSGNGSDSAICIKQHTVALHIYSKKQDKQVINKLEEELSKRGIAYTRQEQSWLETEGLYYIPYSFSFKEKIKY